MSKLIPDEWYGPSWRCLRHFGLAAGESSLPVDRTGPAIATVGMLTGLSTERGRCCSRRRHQRPALSTIARPSATSPRTASLPLLERRGVPPARRRPARHGRARQPEADRGAAGTVRARNLRAGGAVLVLEGDAAEGADLGGAAARSVAPHLRRTGFRARRDVGAVFRHLLEALARTGRRAVLRARLDAVEKRSRVLVLHHGHVVAHYSVGGSATRFRKAPGGVFHNWCASIVQRAPPAIPGRVFGS